MRYKSIKGMEDILPDKIGLWQKLEKIAKRELHSYGYKEIRTPILEETSIFVRGIGVGTDIVKKEMYTFNDRKNRSLTLRPEATAPIARAYVEYFLYKTSPELKVYYIGPMFRSERPQKGRSRQFHQIGVEWLGPQSAYADAELIQQMAKMLQLFGLQGFSIKLNSLGCKKDKDKFADALRKYTKGKQNLLCDDCKGRIKTNTLRILDCKNDTCIQTLKTAPDVLDSLCAPCKDHYEKLKDLLKALSVPFEESRNLVRGLDYYTGPVFEVAHPALGSQDALGAGGRYDSLIEELGGPSTGAIGYALGIERIIIALGDKAGPLAKEDSIFIITLGGEAKLKGIVLADNLRTGLDAPIIFNERDSSLKAQLRAADKVNARFAVIIGENELKEKKVMLKDLREHTQSSIDEDKLMDEIKKVISK